MIMGKKEASAEISADTGKWKKMSNFVSIPVWDKGRMMMIDGL